jgi:hypothetical protein
MTNSFYKLTIVSAMYSFSVNGERSHFTKEKEYDLELWFALSHDIPASYGLYCQIVIDGVAASYTLIPDDECPNVVHFKIRNCILSDHFRSLLWNGFQKMNSHGGRDDVGKSIFGFDFNLYNVELYGPFHSSDLQLRNSKKLAVLTTGIGGTVAYSAIAFARYRNQHWQNLCIIHSDKKSDVTAECLKVNEGRMSPPFALSSVPDIIHFAATGKPLSLASNKSRFCGDNKSHGSEPTSVSAALNAQLKTVDATNNEAQPSSKAAKGVVSAFVTLDGRINTEFTASLLMELHTQGFEFLICSRIWTQVINEANQVTPFTSAFMKSLHIEEFS